MKFIQSIVVVGTVLILISAVYFFGKFKPTQTAPANNQTNPSAQFGFPLDRALERITKKPFGIYITPKTSPVQPEKFTGYHTGTDFEIFPNETNATVSVHSICDGAVVLKRWVSGYGGVLVQGCTYNDQPITVLYGHLEPTSSILQVGDSVVLGQIIGNLGQGYSHATDGERKHLHLGVHKTGKVDLLGYVAKQSDLSQWIDVTTLWK